MFIEVFVVFSLASCFGKSAALNDYSGYSRFLSEEVVYNNPNDTYSPNEYVKYGHMISGQEFGISRAYFQRAAYGAAGLFALGVLSLFFLDCGLLWRCCCKCCKCLTDINDPKYQRKKCCNYAWFYILCFLVLLFDMLVFYGNMQVGDGVDITKSSISGLENIVEDIYVESSALAQSGSDLSDSLVEIENSCPEADFGDLLDTINSFENSIDSLSGQSHSIIKKMDWVIDQIDLYAVEYRMIGMYVLWGLSILAVLLFLLSHCCKSVVSVQLSMFFAQFTFCIYLVLGVIWCMLTTVFSDFCIQPTESLLRVAPGMARDMVMFVATCNGTNSLNKYLNQSQSSLYQAQTQLNDASSQCNSTAFDDAIVAVQGMINGTNEIAGDLSCYRIQKIYLNFFNNGLCTSFYTGIFFIWGSQLLTSFLLFLLVLTAAYMHQYYNEHTVVPTNDDEDAELDEPHSKGHDNDFVADYNKKKAEVQSPNDHYDHNGSHEVVGKNHRLPHQVQVQEDDESFFV